MRVSMFFPPPKHQKKLEPNTRCLLVTMQTARQLSPVPQHVGCGEVRKLEPEDFSPGRTGKAPD